MQVVGRWSREEQQSPVFAGMPPGILDRGAGLTHSPQPVDGLPPHEKATVTHWVEKHEDRLAVFYLPRYSPELNADEYLNNNLKSQVNADGLPDNSKTLRSRIQRFMHQLLNLPEHIKSFFTHPCVQYAAATCE